MLDLSEFLGSQMSSCSKTKISNYICVSKMVKQLHINNCLAYNPVNRVIKWSLGSYLCEKQLNTYKENI